MPFFTIDILEILERGRVRYINMMIFQQTVEEFKVNSVVRDILHLFVMDFRCSSRIIPHHDFLPLLVGQITVHLPVLKAEYVRNFGFESEIPTSFDRQALFTLINKNAVMYDKEADILSVRSKLFDFNNQVAERVHVEVPTCK